MFGVEGTDNLHFAVYAKQLGAGLDEQLERFIREHPDTRLIVIDTLQKIREVSTDAYSYANDYDIVGRMKQFADKNGVCLLLVHHTRKQQAGDKFEMISGTTGLLGCADGAFLLQKEKRTDLNATLEIVGRDQPDQKLHLTRDAEKLTWQLDHAETELWKKTPDPLLSKLAAVIAGDTAASAIRPKKPTLQRERPVSGVTATQQTATASEQPVKSSKPPKADRSTLKKWRT